MNWSDERYVKLYTRQTATWRMWPWQARCVFPLLLQVSDGAGLIDVGARDPIAALAVLVMVPSEVVEVAISALLADGTLELVSGGYLIPKFLEAQEATKTERLKKADQRAGRRAKAREIPRAPVPTCPEVSRLVPPSPAQPSPPPAQPSPGKIPPPQKPAPDPRHAVVVADFDKAFRVLHGKNYPYAKRDFARIKALLARGTPQELLEAWQKALHHQGFPTIATIEDFEKHLPRFIGTGPPGRAADGRAPAPVGDWSNATHGEIPA